MKISPATAADVDEAVDRLAAAFANDGITGFLLNTGPGYRERVSTFFSLLMRARIALDMPVLVARNSTGILGAVMGYATSHPAWPRELSDAWDRFEGSVPGMTQRLAAYEAVSAGCKPSPPHYYLGVIGTDPEAQGHGIGSQLIRTFSDLSAADSLSDGVYLETAQESNLRFYQRAGFVETGRGQLGEATLWCLYLRHESRTL